MSVINNMLRDLDQRQGRAPGEASVGETVRAVPAPRSPWHIGRTARVLIGLILALGALGAWWQLQRQDAVAASPNAVLTAAPPAAGPVVATVVHGPIVAAAPAAPAPAGIGVPAEPSPAGMTVTARPTEMPAQAIAGQTTPRGQTPEPDRVASSEPTPISGTRTTPTTPSMASPHPGLAAPASRASTRAPALLQTSAVGEALPGRPVPLRAPAGSAAPPPPLMLAQARLPARPAAPAASLATAALAAPSMTVARGEPGGSLVSRSAGPAARPEGKTYNPRQAAARMVADAQQLERQGRPDEARVLLQRALVAHPAELPARQMLVQAHLDAGQLDDAQTLLSEGLRLHPEQPALTHTSARLKVERGDLAGAIQLLEAARGAVQQDPASRALLGALLLRVHRYDESAQHYLAALRADPGNSSWLVGAGVALEAIGKTGDAAEAYRRASMAQGLTPALAAFLGERLARLATAATGASRP